MTNPTPHGQVPDALIDLIDAYAETRHRCGGVYNAKTEAARKAVIEALSGVQALSAGPMVTSEQRRLIGVIAEKIEDGTLFQSGIYQKKDLARFVRNMLDVTPTAPAASPTPPVEQQAQPGAVYAELHEPDATTVGLGAVWNRHSMRDFADRTHALRMEQATPKAAPAVPTSVKGAMWFTKKPVTIQAIQWTGENLREVITFTDGPPDTRSHHAGMAWDAYRDLVARDGLKIYTLEGKMLASPGDWIIRGVKGELYPCKPDIFQETYAAASPTPPAEQQAAPKAAPGDAIDEAMRERDDAEDFIDALLDEVLGHERPEWSSSYGHADALNDVQERMTALHKPAVDKAWGRFQSAMAAPQQEAQEPTTVDKKTMELAESVGLIGPASRVGDLHAAIQRFHDLICVNATIKAAVMAAEAIGKQQAAPQQEAQEPVAWLSPWRADQVTTDYDAYGERGIPLYTAPQPAPAPLSDDAKDAARWRMAALIGKELMLRPDKRTHATAVKAYMDATHSGSDLTGAVDAAIAAQGGKCPMRIEP